jgi:hypothetical protein
MSIRFQQFIGVSIFLPLANTAYQLGPLIGAGLVATNDESQPPTTARELGLQLHPGSAGTLYVGDQNVSTGRCAYVLVASGTDRDRAAGNQIPLAEMWLLSDTAATRVNVLILQ